MRTAIPLGLEKTVLNTIGQHLATTEELALGSKGERKRRREGRKEGGRERERDRERQRETESEKSKSIEINLPEQISPYTFTKELIIQLPSPEKIKRLSHTKNEASLSTAPALVPLFMKQRKRTRNQCRGKVRCYTNQIAASAFLQRDGKTVILVDSDSPQLTTGT